jgi:transposase
MGRKRRVRRSWSDDEKCRIVAQTRVPGVSVSQVARRYDVNANQVFNWIRDPRFCPGDVAVSDVAFLPVEVVAEPEPRSLVSVDPGGSIEIELANGHRLRVNGAFDPDAVARLARSLGA